LLNGALLEMEEVSPTPHPMSFRLGLEDQCAEKLRAFSLVFLLRILCFISKLAPFDPILLNSILPLFSGLKSNSFFIFPIEELSLSPLTPPSFLHSRLVIALIASLPSPDMISNPRQFPPLIQPPSLLCLSVRVGWELPHPLVWIGLNVPRCPLMLSAFFILFSSSRSWEPALEVALLRIVLSSYWSR